MIIMWLLCYIMLHNMPSMNAVEQLQDGLLWSCASIVWYGYAHCGHRTGNS